MKTNKQTQTLPNDPDGHEASSARSGYAALAEQLHDIGMKAMNRLPGGHIKEPKWIEMSERSRKGWESIAEFVVKRQNDQAHLRP